MPQFFPTLIPYRKGALWGYTDREKQIKIDMQYDQAYPFVGNIARVIKNGLSGLIDRNGNEVLPIAYEEVGSIITGTFMNDNGTCTIYHEGKHGLVSINGDILADVVFNSEQEAFDHAEQNGWKGAIPFDLYPEMPEDVVKTIEATKHDYNRVVPFKCNGLWGLITIEGKELCPPQYDNIENAENGYWPFMENGKWGLLDPEGNELITARFDQIRGFSNGQAACRLRESWGAIDVNGHWMITPQFDELGELKDGLVAAEKNGFYGFVDERGNTVIDFQFRHVMDFENEVCMVFEDEFIYFIDTKGTRISINYTRIFGPDAQGLTHVMTGDKWGLVQADGKFILPIEYDLPKAMGQVIQTIEEDRIPIKRGALLGYADMQGREIVAPKYVVIDAYCEGLSLVSIPDERLNFGKTPEMMEEEGSISGVFKYGFIDKNGKEVVPLKYNLAHRFQNGLAFVQSVAGSAGYITYDGTEYFEDSSYL
ncbi:MAG: WG repeat-containing protein [Bacteroidota bacterium]